MAQTAPPMLADVYNDPNLAPFLGSDESGDASMEQRPMTGSASGSMKPTVEPAQTDTKSLGVSGRMAPEPMAPQVGPPPQGKEEFHNTMSDFGHRAEANRAAVIGLNPSDPDYLKKLEALQAQHGAITQEKARYQMLHPWGGPESEHSGILGQIGHVASEVGQVAGSVVAPNLMQEIPGTQANLRAKGAGGAAEENAAIGNEAKTGGTEAKETAAQAKEEVAPSTAAKNEAQTEAIKHPPLKTMQQELATATQDAQTRGVDPMTDPKVQQLTNVIKETQKQTEQALDKQYNDAVADSDHEKAERLLKVKHDLAVAAQPPQRPPQMLVVTPGGQVENAKPGAVLPEGTQTPSGFGSEFRPTNQTRAMSEMADSVLKQAPVIKSEIDKLAEKIGPGQGRWNQFWVNKGGIDDPDFAGLDTDLDLYASALVRTHFGARGGQQYREELRKQFSEAQSPEDLKSRIDHAEGWIQGYANAGKPSNGPSVSGGSNKQSYKNWKASQGAANAPAGH